MSKPPTFKLECSGWLVALLVMLFALLLLCGCATPRNHRFLEADPQPSTFDPRPATAAGVWVTNIYFLPFVEYEQLP